MAVAGLITASGLVFSVYAFIKNIRFTMMGFELPGFLFGAVAAFLGVRYIMATIKFAKELAGDDQSV